MAGPANRDARNGMMSDQDTISQEITELDADIAALRARFDQYFLGLEKKNPTKDMEELKKCILKLKGQFIRNTALKFRVQTLYSKFQSYERLWTKTVKEIEEGTYRKDLMRLRRKNLTKGGRAAEGGQNRKKADDGSKEPDEQEAPNKRPDLQSLDNLEADLPEDLFEDFAPSPPVARPPPMPKGMPALPVSNISPAPQAAPPSPPRQNAPPPPPGATRPPVPTVSQQPASLRSPPPPPRGAMASSGPPAMPSSAHAGPPPPPRAATVSMPRTATGSIPIPVTPGTKPPAAPPARADAPLSGEKLNQLYNAYITAKKRCKESTAGITPEAIAQSLRKQIPGLMQQHGAKSVDFKVVIKDGKAVLKAVPKP